MPVPSPLFSLPADGQHAAARSENDRAVPVSAVDSGPGRLPSGQGVRMRMPIAVQVACLRHRVPGCDGHRPGDVGGMPGPVVRHQRDIGRQGTGQGICFRTLACPKVRSGYPIYGVPGRRQ